MFLSQLAKLANVYDQMGQTKKADRLDIFINKWAEEEKEPTMEDLMGEEKWLKEEGIVTDDGDDGETYFEEDPLEGLSEMDHGIGKAFLEAGSDIPALLQQLDEQRKRILDQLQALQDDQPKFEPEISNLPLTPEASLMRDLEKLATLLDEQQMYKHASFFDGMLTKLAQGVPPNDLFDETDADDLEQEFKDIDYIGPTETPETPETPEASWEDKEMDIQFAALDLLQAIAQGEVVSLEEIKNEAQEILQEYQQLMSSAEKDEVAQPEKPLGQVIEFTRG